MVDNQVSIKKLIESLSPNERRIIPHLKEKSIKNIAEKSSLDQISVTRAIEFLNNKKIVILSSKKQRIIDLDINGILYLKKGLPERILLHALGEKRIIKIEDAEKETLLSGEEVKAAIGALKKKAMIEIKNGKIILNASKEEISKKMLEEIFIESLPIDNDKISPEQQYSLNLLKNRKGIIQIKENNEVDIEVTELGKKISADKNAILKNSGMIEQLTPDIIKKVSAWKGKKFRRYDVTSTVPKIYGGKRHFVNQASDYARKIWTEIGFVEMTGEIAVSSFWNFDALFQPQDHPARDMHDTFFIDKKSSLPEKKIVDAVKESHEKGIDGSKGWKYEWDEEEAKKIVLRTHTTCLSSQTLAKISINKESLPAKYFAIGKCFRNETLDWNHGFEFNQTEGIVIDNNANFRHLLGYLNQFFKKMGIENIRFTPSYFPYTEPSVEISTWNNEKKIWLELGGAGMLRPEVTIPLLGKHIPVLAWGPGFDRIIMDYYKIKDLREMYKNDITKLREMKVWMKS